MVGGRTSATRGFQRLSLYPGWCYERLAVEKCGTSGNNAERYQSRREPRCRREDSQSSEQNIELGRMKEAREDKDAQGSR